LFVSNGQHQLKRQLAIKAVIQKIDFEKAQKELVERDVAIEAKKRAAEETAAWVKRIEEEKEILEKKIIEERDAWERKMEAEKRSAQAKGAENAVKQIEAAQKVAEKMAEEEKEAKLRARHIMIPWPSLWKRG